MSRHAEWESKRYRVQSNPTILDASEEAIRLARGRRRWFVRLLSFVHVAISLRE